MSTNMPKDDKSLSQDALVHMKQLNSVYHSSITEAASENLKKDLMDLYRDEQNNLYKLFNVMQARGWYEKPKEADAQQISQARQRFESEAQKVFTGTGTQRGFMGAQGTQPQSEQRFGGTGTTQGSQARNTGEQRPQI